MALIEIEVTNQSTVLNDNQLQSALPAWQTQVHRDFAPAWGIDAHLTFIEKGTAPSSTAWMLGIFDNSDQANALGYHELSPQGTPLAKVFAESDIQASSSWTVTASHELLEMLADPDIDLTVFVQPNSNTGTLYSYECCDACEADNFGYTIEGVSLSDFVFPTWFESFRAAGSTLFDFSKEINEPFQILVGGYIGVFDVTSGSGWQQLTSRGLIRKESFVGRIDSRLDRRALTRDLWRKSQPES